MAAISWKSPVTGSWTTVADWSTGTDRAAGDDVTIGVGGGLHRLDHRAAGLRSTR